MKPLSVLFLGALATSPAAACRCPELTFDTYYQRAEVVLIGHATRVSEVFGANGEALVEVELRPLFRQGRVFKGELVGRDLLTSDSSASCGVPVQVGENYLVFASSSGGDGPLYFDSCSGSRLYAGGARGDESPAFTGLDNRRIVPRLFELLEDAVGVAPVGDTPFHTSPACWEEARFFHEGRPAEEYRRRVAVTWRSVSMPESEAQLSPNGAYRLWKRAPDTSQPGPWTAEVIVDVERDRSLVLGLEDVAGYEVVAEWVNEKLLYVRVPWGRVAFSDLILDVEHGVLVHEEAVRYGQIAFQQYQGECAGQCPCLAVPGSRGDLPRAPNSSPATGAAAVDLSGWPRSLAFLNGAWDGRVFSEAAGTVFTRSEVRNRPGREEYAVEILEVRETAAGTWLHLEIYSNSPCSDPTPSVVHAGWVPAYTTDGRLVAGVYPGGC